jgi:hypothetical protein
MPRKTQYRKNRNKKSQNKSGKKSRKYGKKSRKSGGTCGLCNKNKKQQQLVQLGGCGCEKNVGTYLGGGGGDLQMGSYNSTENSSINAYPLNTYNNIPDNISSRNFANGVYFGGKNVNKNMNKNMNKNNKKIMKGGGFWDYFVDPIMGSSNSAILNSNSVSGAIYGANVISGSNLPSNIGVPGLNQPAASFFNKFNLPLA